MFNYAHIGYYIKQVFLPYVNNIKLLITDIHNRINYSSPVGSIVTWSIPGEPIGVSKGYLLECNGQSFDPEKYPNLYKALGIDRVPNYRGQFLRCEREMVILLVTRYRTALCPTTTPNQPTIIIGLENW